jgi:hypothetical protein
MYSWDQIEHLRQKAKEQEQERAVPAEAEDAEDRETELSVDSPLGEAANRGQSGD